VVEIVLTYHSLGEDAQAGFTAGWRQTPLSPAGREEARALGDRWRHERIAAVFSSDLRRAVETAQIAFQGTSIPQFADWRLRECNFGAYAGTGVGGVLRHWRQHLEEPYLDGESWHQAIDRVARFLDDLAAYWQGQRVLLIGHVATRWALDHRLAGIPVDALEIPGDDSGREWTYRLS